MIEYKEINLPQQHYRYNKNLPTAEELITEHDSGSSWKDIAAKYDVPENTIWSRIKALRDINSGKRKPVLVRSGEDNGMYREDLDSQKMVQDYLDGLSTNEIAEKYKCGKTTVKRKLHKAGVEMRVQQPKPVKVKEPKPIREPEIVYPRGIILDNKYSQKYHAITQRGFLRNPTNGEYHELHHAHPKALGGSNEPENLVYLTPKEHYICHHLLTKCTAGDDKRRMVYAWHLMCYCDKTGNRYIPAIQYDFLRKELALVGKSPEHKAKMSIAAKNRKKRIFSEQAKKNMSEARKKDWAEGKFTNEHMKGPKSEKHKEKIKQALMGNNNRNGGSRKEFIQKIKDEYKQKAIVSC